MKIPFNDVVFNDTDRGLFNVVVTRLEETPQGMELCPTTVQIDITWAEACAYMPRVLREMAQGEWEGGRIKDVNLAPAPVRVAGIPRPWSPELWAMHQREMARERTEMTEWERASGEWMHANVAALFEKRGLEAAEMQKPSLARGLVNAANQ